MENNNVGLAVVIYKDNFGSALQTYATQRFVDGLGYKAECINTDGIQKIINSKKKKYYIKRLFNKDEFRYLFALIKSKFKKKSSNEYYKNTKIRHEQYTRFYDTYLHFSPKTFSFDELAVMTKRYSSVVVGSDQLWRPSNISGGYFTLEFVPEGVKRIAYSTSFGVAKLPKTIQGKAKHFLNKMDYISVREKSGRIIIKEMIDKDVQVVCDPTMLLTKKEWDDLSGYHRFSEGDYILCYIMGDDKQQRRFVQKLRDRTGFKVIGLLHGSVYIPEDEKWVDEKPFDVGPAEFINLIKNAKYICTDSFHCSVFSILFQKNFFVFYRDGKNPETSANDRINTLLEHTGLSNRLFTGNESITDKIVEDIDYDGVEDKINELRKDSIVYLKNALKK